MRGTEVVLRVVGGVMALGSIALLLWGFGCEVAVLLRLGGGFWWRVAALSAFSVWVLALVWWAFGAGWGCLGGECATLFGKRKEAFFATPRHEVGREGYPDGPMDGVDGLVRGQGRDVLFWGPDLRRCSV